MSCFCFKGAEVLWGLWADGMAAWYNTVLAGPMAALRRSRRARHGTVSHGRAVCHSTATLCMSRIRARARGFWPSGQVRVVPYAGGTVTHSHACPQQRWPSCRVDTLTVVLCFGLWDFQPKRDNPKANIQRALNMLHDTISGARALRCT